MRLATFYAPVAALAMLFIAGCQTYERDPLNLDQHRQAWRERSPDSESVVDFAERLRAEGRLADVYDTSDGLTIREAEVVSLVFNPDLRLARARAGLAAVTAANAGLWEDPVFQIDVLRITESVSDPWIVTPGLALTIPLSGRLEAEKDRADAALRSELYRIAEAEWEMRAQLRQLWASWSAAQMSLLETERLVHQLDSLVASTQQLAEAGELVRTEAALFRIEQAQRRNTLLRLRGDVAEFEQRIRGLLGLAPDAPVELVPTLDTVPEDTAPSSVLAVNNLSLARLQEDYEVAEQKLRREILKQYPDLTIGPLYESDEGQSRVGFLGAIPLPILNANRQGIAEAQAERSLARAEYETEYERIMAALAGAQARMDAVRMQREEVEHVVIPLVDQQVGDARQLLQLGEGGALVLLESQTRAFETKLQLIELRLREAIAESDLARLTGPRSTDTDSAATDGDEETP